jgi:hypothetical protein
MFAGVLRVHDGLLTSSRLPSLSRPGRSVATVEVAVLVFLGAAAAAATALPDLRLGIPGHAILRSVFPMALGLALVPRRLAGSVMGVSAVATSLLFRAGGLSGGPGALTSLYLTGPLLDLALVGAGRPWRLYLGLLLAGLGSNLVALFVRGGFKTFTLGHGGRRGAEAWWHQAAITYPLCGALAGLVSALVWFHLRGRHRDAKEEGGTA